MVDMKNKTERTSGLLLPLFSLPSPYGIGSLGRAAHEFLEQLRQAGQSWWQMLPLGPTGYGDSPYQSLCSLAGNPYFIDLDDLYEQGLLDKADLDGATSGHDPALIDYGDLFQRRYQILGKAWEKARSHRLWQEKLAEFAAAEGEWLEDHALYAALKQEFGYRPWYEWPEPLRDRQSWALDQARSTYKDSIRQQEFYQLLFFRQWQELRRHAQQAGIRLLGDLPLYCARDSADVWAAPEQFLLDASGTPLAVAGCPPDGFAIEGQLWGNPLYDWDKMRDQGFSWWQKRMQGAARLFDGLRIDHFRGLEAYWRIPFGQSAVYGSWQPGPGLDFIRAMEEACPHTLLICEDLGFLTESVHELRRKCGLPGMKVLQFAFDEDDSPYLPRNYEENCVCYMGTHDNPTLRSWIETAPAQERARACDYLGLQANCADSQLAEGLLQAGMGSPAELCVLMLADLLGLGDEARINRPSFAQGNWRWRLLPGQFDRDQIERLAHLTRLYGRSPQEGAAEAER